MYHRPNCGLCQRRVGLWRVALAVRCWEISGLATRQERTKFSPSCTGELSESVARPALSTLVRAGVTLVGAGGVCSGPGAGKACQGVGTGHRVRLAGCLSLEAIRQMACAVAVNRSLGLPEQGRRCRQPAASSLSSCRRRLGQFLAPSAGLAFPRRDPAGQMLPAGAPHLGHTVGFCPAALWETPSGGLGVIPHPAMQRAYQPLLRIRRQGLRQQAGARSRGDAAGRSCPCG